MLTLALRGALIAARRLLYGVDAAPGTRKAPGLRAILLTLALNFAAHNAVTAARMNAAPRSPQARRLNQPLAAVWSSPGSLLTVCGSDTKFSAERRKFGLTVHAQ